MNLYTYGVLRIYILRISCVHMFSSYPVDPHICYSAQHFPTYFHRDLVSHGTLHIQTCRSVQIFESAYLGSPAPRELYGRPLLRKAG